MLDQLLAAQKKAEEIKKKLETTLVYGEVEGGAIKITATANQMVTAIEIKEEFFKEIDKEALEELLITAINKALNQATKVSAAEMQAISKDMFGGMMLDS